MQQVFVGTHTKGTHILKQDSVENYIKEYPNQEQVKMMKAWLEENEPGTFHFTGLVDPTDDTVVTPQASVDYGYNWFSLSDGPAIVRTPHYDRFFSVSIFDMKHNVPAVIKNPEKPILLSRPGQDSPAEDVHIVELETDQGLAFTRMVVVDNMEEVRGLSRSIVMAGGKGNMHRDVQRFSPEVEQAALGIIEAATGLISRLEIDYFGKRTGDVGDLTLAAAVMFGQLGTPADTVRYRLFLRDANGEPLNGENTYFVTVPTGIVEEGGYFSVTVYGVSNKLLIPNDKQIYDRTTYTSKQNQDGTYTITLSPNGAGLNGIPTGQPFYGILRAYVPVPGADLAVQVIKE